MLSLDTIDKIKIEYPEVFDDLFENSLKMLEKVMNLKIDAYKQFEKINLLKSINSKANTSALRRLLSRISGSISGSNSDLNNGIDDINEFKTQ